MSLAKVYLLQERAEQSPSVDAYDTLANEELVYLAAQKQKLQDAENKNASLARRKLELAAELANLRESISASSREHALLQEQVLQKQKERERALPDAECEAYRQTWLQLLKEFTTRKETLLFLLAYPASSFKFVDLSVVAHWLDTWGTFFTEADVAVRQLKHQERDYSNGNTLPPTKDLYAVLDEVCSLQLQARSVVGRERYRRSAVCEESIEDFMDSQGQLLTWCNKQIETLASLSSFGDLKEFSTSFHANVPVMDSNFLVLMEQSESLADDPRVQRASQEVNNAWIRLSWRTYEKVHQVFYSNLEHEAMCKQCAGWSAQLGSRVRALLVSVEKHLKASGSDAEELASQCAELMKTHDGYGVICLHLSDFGIRVDCLKPYLSALQNELLSPLTSTVLGFPSYEDYEGRAEHRNRMEELQEWIEVKSQKGTYVKILERLEDTKKTIQEYADVLFPEED